MTCKLGLILMYFWSFYFLKVVSLAVGAFYIVLSMDLNSEALQFVNKFYLAQILCYFTLCFVIKRCFQIHCYVLLSEQVQR